MLTQTTRGTLSRALSAGAAISCPPSLRFFHTSAVTLSDSPQAPARHQDMLSPELRAKISKQGRGQVVETPLSAEDEKNPIKSIWSKITDRIQVGKEFVTYLPATDAHPHPSGLKYRSPSPGSQPTASIPSHYPELDYDISFYNRKQKELTGYSTEDKAYDYDANGIPRHVDRPKWVSDEQSLAFMKDHFRNSGGLPLMGHYTNSDQDYGLLSADVYHKQDYGNGLFEDVENTQKKAQDVADKYDMLRYEGWDEWVNTPAAQARRDEQAKKNQLYEMSVKAEESAYLVKHIARASIDPAQKKKVVDILVSLSESALRSVCEQWGLPSDGDKGKLGERLITNLPKVSMKQWKAPSAEDLQKLYDAGFFTQTDILTESFKRHFS